MESINSVQDPTFQMVADLPAARKAYVKLGGYCITSKVGAPSYSDSVTVAASFAPCT